MEVLVGNKLDEISTPVLDMSEISRNKLSEYYSKAIGFAFENDIPFVQISIKDKINLEIVLYLLLHLMMK